MIAARISVVEAMGNELFAYFELNGARMIARIPFAPGKAISHGDNLRLHFDMAHCHLFDMESEQALFD
ncbi:Putative transporter ATP-binding protein [Brenneria goodwinii]|uniref:Putative transporter ATP-binding protein n=1 Tax=Brenneria goodwinii TaxID=1109412 RepID=A0A0G4JZJ0_9GAMM|nr:TOBE domain-containing protein [Brenneria goodwinii]CPR19593.1 Putative transporter ATP-binding protein [Brenneria goodwinii]